MEDPNLALEHQNVPQAHRSLHDFLYDSEDAHGVSASPGAIAPDGTEILALAEWCDRAANARIAGVYAVLDSHQNTQYVGISRNVLTALNGHVAQYGPETCAFVRVQAFKFPKRTEMEQLRDEWIAASAEVPLGNQSGKWASSIAEVAQIAMSADERLAHEEKKLKLRKAMADSSLSRELDSQAAAMATDGATATDLERRQALTAALTEDDWSAVIQTQTTGTLE